MFLARVARLSGARAFSTRPAFAQLSYNDVIHAKTVADADAQFEEVRSTLENYDSQRERLLKAGNKVDIEKVAEIEQLIKKEIAAANDVDTSSFAPEVAAEFNKLRAAVQEQYRALDAFSPGTFKAPNWDEVQENAPAPSVFEEYKQILTNFELPEVKMDVNPLIKYFERNHRDLKEFALQSQKRMEELGFKGDTDIDPRFLLELGETPEAAAEALGLSAQDTVFLAEWEKAVAAGKDPLMNEDLAKDGDLESIVYLNDQIARTLGVEPKDGEHATIEDVLAKFPQWEQEIYDDLMADAWDESSAAEMNGEVAADVKPTKPEWLSNVELPNEK